MLKAFPSAPPPGGPPLGWGGRRRKHRKNLKKRNGNSGGRENSGYGNSGIFVPREAVNPLRTFVNSYFEEPGIFAPPGIFDPPGISVSFLKKLKVFTSATLPRWGPPLGAALEGP